MTIEPLQGRFEDKLLHQRRHGFIHAIGVCQNHPGDSLSYSTNIALDNIIAAPCCLAIRSDCHKLTGSVSKAFSISTGLFPINGLAVMHCNGNRFVGQHFALDPRVVPTNRIRRIPSDKLPRHGNGRIPRASPFRRLQSQWSFRHHPRFPCPTRRSAVLAHPVGPAKYQEKSHPKQIGHQRRATITDEQQGQPSWAITPVTTPAFNQCLHADQHGDAHRQMAARQLRARLAI